jgi:hypothetical protein
MEPARAARLLSASRRLAWGDRIGDQAGVRRYPRRRAKCHASERRLRPDRTHAPAWKQSPGAGRARSRSLLHCRRRSRAGLTPASRLEPAEGEGDCRPPAADDDARRSWMQPCPWRPSDCRIASEGAARSSVGRSLLAHSPSRRSELSGAERRAVAYADAGLNDGGERFCVSSVAAGRAAPADTFASTRRGGPAERRNCRRFRFVGLRGRGAVSRLSVLAAVARRAPEAGAARGGVRGGTSRSRDRPPGRCGRQRRLRAAPRTVPVGQNLQ